MEKRKIDTYSQIPLNKKVYPKLDSITRTKLRNEYLGGKPKQLREILVL